MRGNACFVKVSLRFLFIALFLFLAGLDVNIYSAGPVHKKTEEQWQARNRHLIPSPSEIELIMDFDQDSDGLKNRDDPDIDGDGRDNHVDRDIDNDGVKNAFDPSPYDWREIGYSPFSMLAFLSWNHEWNNYKYDRKKLERAVKLLKEAGCSYVRVDFYWNDIEPARGKFDFAKYDFLVDLVSKNNIRILPILGYSADWASSVWNNPPRKIEDFSNYCARVVKRYKNRIKYWEIWNEPDSPAYWVPQDYMKKYTALLKSAYTRIKEEDPTSKVVLGGLTSGGYYALQNIYREGGRDYFDVVNFHPFVDPLCQGSVEQIKIIYKNIKRLMAGYNDQEKKIWFTELGCPGVSSNNKNNNWWLGTSPKEERQALFLETVYQELLSLPDVEKIFWAYFRDNKEHFHSGVDYFGLIRWDFSLKPAYSAYKQVFRHWKRLNRKGR